MCRCRFAAPWVIHYLVKLFAYYTLTYVHTHLFNPITKTTLEDVILQTDFWTKLTLPKGRVIRNFSLTRSSSLARFLKNTFNARAQLGNVR
jgi:hypothetical protein